MAPLSRLLAALLLNLFARAAAAAAAAAAAPPSFFSGTGTGDAAEWLALLNTARSQWARPARSGRQTRSCRAFLSSTTHRGTR